MHRCKLAELMIMPQTSQQRAEGKMNEAGRMEKRPLKG